MDRASVSCGDVDGASYRDLSFWWDSLPDNLAASRRQSLDGNTTADVAIIGAGYTGLWTAYYLLKAHPELQVIVIERETAGFGASGRNGGWCTAILPVSWTALAKTSSPEAAVRMQRAMFDTIDEVGSVVKREGLDVHWTKGGAAWAARSPAQVVRAQRWLEEARSWGFGHEDFSWLDSDQTAQHLSVTQNLGSTFTPHTAVLHPARLARELARVVEKLGARIVEGTTATEITPRVVSTDCGEVKARHVIRATEGYTAQLRSHRRDFLPIYSLMVATEPLPDDVWSDIGLSKRQAFRDQRHSIIYGQRTADNRIAFGGRGTPYRYGSRLSSPYHRDKAVSARLQHILRDLFPILSDTEFSHAWGGPLGVARDWHPSVGYNTDTGVGWAGGYVGDGVATSNLAGRTLADFIMSTDSTLTRLPWAGHHSRRWELEPLRYIGVNFGMRLTESADAVENRTGLPARRARVLARLTGN